MKFKLDENMPVDVQRVLVELGHNADTVADEGLTGVADPDVFRAAIADGRIVLSQDVGFVQAAASLGSRGTVVLFGLQEPNRRNLAAKTLELFGRSGIEIAEDSVVVVTDQKVRIRPLKRA